MIKPILAVLGAVLLASAPARDFTDTKLQVQLASGLLNDSTRAQYLEAVRQTEADGLQLIACEFFVDGEQRQTALRNLAESIRFFEAAGYPVAVWTSTLGYGAERNADFRRRFPRARKLRGFDGTEAATCTTDAAVAAAIQENLRDFVRAGAKTILLDDDFIQCCRPGQCCCVCDEHLRRYAAKLGRDRLTAAEVAAAYAGPSNAVRSAVLAVLGETLTNYAAGLRAAVDELDPTVNIGLCSSFTLFDLEGVDAEALVKRLAGRGRRPLMRVSGATYWPTGWVAPRYSGQNLVGVLEFVRRQVADFGRRGMAILDENDTCPRDPEWVPSGMAELYDKAMIVEGGVIRNKYILRQNRMDPARQIAPEYLEGHLQNLAHDRELAASFRGAEPVGFRVFMADGLFAQTEVPEPFPGEDWLKTRYSQPMAGIFLANAGFATQYRNDREPWAVFGPSALALPETALAVGVLLDREAAEVLERRGIDVGLKAKSPKALGGWWCYTNDHGQRFAVYPKAWSNLDFRREAPQWLDVAAAWRFLTGGRAEPVRVRGAKGIYPLVKRRADGTLVALVMNACDRPTGQFTLVLGDREFELELGAWGWTTVESAPIAGRGAGRPAHGTLILTFDDRNFRDWQQAQPLFAKYGAHATFFVSGELDDTAEGVLRELQEAGHTLGLHGLNHQNAPTGGTPAEVESYYAREIAPQREQFRRAGLKAEVFAYPNGRSSAATDSVILGHGFKRVRGTGGKFRPYDPKGEKRAQLQPLVSLDAAFLKPGELERTVKMHGVLLGSAYNTDIDEVVAALERAAARNETFQLISHGISATPNAISMRLEWLETILKTAARLGMAMPGYAELPAAPVTAVAKIDFAARAGKVKPLHGVNNSPVRVGKQATQHEFAAAGIPFVRTHDTAGMFGGAHYVDVPNIFRDFAADENDPANYDFAFTDAYLRPLVEAGSEIFFRLGVTIENYWRIRSYNIDPPADFAKWARICEHIVRHYNEGWADGYRWQIRYWEIWNEPENPPMWKGTKEQLFELYRVTANHLKACFPAIRVGGYAGCGFYCVDDHGYRMRHNDFYQGFRTWFEDFCRFVTAAETRAPLDFFSWHLYLYEGTTPERIAVHADYVRRTLDAAGLTATESIFDEWNWNPMADWVRVKGNEGAAVMAGAFAVMQNAPVDIAMYYDALPTRGHGGLFYFPNVEPTPTYYAFMAFNELYRLGTAVRAEAFGDGVYALAATDGRDQAILLANRNDEDRLLELTVGGYEGGFRLYRIAAGDRELEERGAWRGGEQFRLPHNSVALLTTRKVDVAAARQKPTAKKSINGLDDGQVASDPYEFKPLEVREVKPQAISRNAAGHELVDFGLASCGWLELAGAGEYEIVVGELTNGEGRVANEYPRSTIYVRTLKGVAPGLRDYRAPFAEDLDFVKYHGWDVRGNAIKLPKHIGDITPFRFAEIVKAPCAAAELRQQAVNYPIDMTKSSFESDNADLVRLYDFCKHSIRATSYCGMYIDGDRERRPYEADAYINQLCHYAIDNDYSLARKTHEYLLREAPTWPTEWKQHSIMMAWTDWMWSGDNNSLKGYYDVLKSQKLDAGWRARADGLLVTSGFSDRGERDIVDWPAGERDNFDFRRVNAVVNAFRYLNLRQMDDIATELQEPEDAQAFTALAERVKAAYEKAFYNPETGLYVDGEGSSHSSLHANAAALAFGLVPAERQAKVADFLEAKGMVCSVYFAQYYLEALYAAGRDEAAMKLILAKGDRSWLGMLDFGSTVSMEAWNMRAKPNQDLTHAWGAVPLNIIARYVLGVTPLEPGFKKARIAPHPAGIRYLKGTVPTAAGPITVEIKDGKVTVDTAVPYELHLPACP